MNTNKLIKGTRVTINRNHAGCRGLRGIVRSNVTMKAQGRDYYKVQIARESGKRMTLRFLASEMTIA